MKINKYEASPREFLTNIFFVAAVEVRRTFHSVASLAQMRHPGRSMCANLDRCIFIEFHDKLLDKKNFKMSKYATCVEMFVHQWSHCFSYDLESRKGACKITRTRGMGINVALWWAVADNEHRAENWVQLVAMVNSSSQFGNNEEVAAPRNEVKVLLSAVHKSRTPPRLMDISKPVNWQFRLRSTWPFLGRAWAHKVTAKENKAIVKDRRAAVAVTTRVQAKAKSLAKRVCKNTDKKAQQSEV